MTGTTQNIVPLKTLVRASFAAAVFAGVAIVTVILPAEYNIDPLGVGKMLGLNKLAVTATDLPEAADVGGASDAGAVREDEIVIDIPAGKGLEYKFHVMTGDKLQYEWSVEGGELYFDFHGEPQGDTTGYFESFTISTADGVKGLFYAPFEGSHGWYWKNKGSEPLKIKLKTSGTYDVIGLK